MKNLINRAKYVTTGEDGASTMEIIVWFALILTIATVLFIFRDQVLSFLRSATNQVEDLGTAVDNVGGF